MFKNKKILIPLIIIAAILIIGIEILIVNGLEYSLRYSQNDKLNIYIETGYNSKDIKEITKEVLEDSKFDIQSGGTNKNVVVITAKEISEEQMDGIIEKINEKYEIELDRDENARKTTNSNVELIDIIMPYIMSTVVSAMLILAYMMIRYRKIGIIKVMVSTTLVIIATQLLYISIVAIIRIPVTLLTMPISLVLFVLSIIVCGLTFEKKMKAIKSEQKAK